MKPAEFRLQHVDITAFAAEGQTHSGALDAATLERLWGSLHLHDSPQAVTIHWNARGEMKKLRGGLTETWLHLQARTKAPLQCQRCLGTLQAELQVDRAFLFAKDEAQAERWDDERDEDVLVASRNFDLQALIEDELLLALPIVPLHETCPTPVKMSVGEEDLLAQEDPREHPFAALAALKTSKP